MIATERFSSMTASPSQLSAEDQEALLRAYRALEHPSLAARASSVLGAPVEQGLRLLPQDWYARVHRAAEAAIAKALGLAINSLGRKPPAGAHDEVHRLLAISSGAVGGFFGLPALLIELPVTTVILLRSIADVAHARGEDLSLPETRLACLEVFAIGGRSHDDDYAEIGYYELRAMLAWHFSRVFDLVTKGSAAGERLPATIQLVRAIAARFGIVVSDKAAAQLVPVAGALAGALANAMFLQHFQIVADGHFTIRQLERSYGREIVEATYRGLAETDRDSFRG
jgi:hypothetical protein